MLALISELAPAIAIVAFFVYIAVVMTKFIVKFDHRLEAVEMRVEALEARVSHIEKDLATVKEVVNQILVVVSSQKT